MSDENPEDPVAVAAVNPEDDEQPTLSLQDIKEIVDAEDDRMAAVFAGSDERNCSYPQGYVKRQAIFACATCSNKNKSESTSRECFPEPAGICLACAIACHADHELIELYTKRRFRCDCGNSRLTEVACRLFPDKEADNPQNAYNHNFSGFYCVCNKTYPCDPDDSEVDKIEDEEMVQCIVCEDWYHACHLDLPPDDVDLLNKDDEEYELVCPSCSSENPFLISYYDFFKVRLGASVASGSLSEELKLEPSSCFLSKISKAITESSPKAKALLFPPSWRSDLCQCPSCMTLYAEKNIDFITDLSDTLAAYESAGRAKTADAGGASISDRLATATLAGIRDRVKQTEVAHGFAEFKNQLTEFIQEVGKRKRVITEDDVNEFFEQLNDRKRKRADCGSSGAASSSNSRSTGGGDDEDFSGAGASGIGTPPSNCHGSW